MRLRSGDILVIATSNQKKIDEFKLILKPYSLKILSLTDLNIPSPDETGINFKDNALIKALACTNHSACEWAVLADDSGLCVRALGGQPGVFTDRWAGPEKDYNHAMQKLNDEVIQIKGLSLSVRSPSNLRATAILFSLKDVLKANLSGPRAVLII